MNASVETLESRRLLASSAELVGDVLVVRGDLLAANTINITNNANGTQVDVSVVYTPAGGTQQTLNESFDKSDFVLLKIRGGLRGDTITLGTESSPYTGNSRINGVSGGDTINGGEGNDRIAGGRGNDVINGNGGADRIFGETGSDNISGGDGGDVLWGGRGDDTVNGGAGDDVLGGVLGAANNMTGGEGADVFVIKNGGQSQATDFVENVDRFHVIGTGQGDLNAQPTA